MFGLARFRFNKRKAITVILCFIAVLTPVLLLLNSAEKHMRQAEVFDLSVGELISRKKVPGNALNLQEIGSENLITNGGFEPFIYSKTLQVSGFDAETIFINGADQESNPSYNLPLDDFFIGSRISLYRPQGASNNLISKNRVKDIQEGSLSRFRFYDLRPPKKRKFTWTTAYHEAHELIIGGESGCLLLNPFSDPQYLYSPAGETLEDIIKVDGNLFVLDAGGRIFKVSGESWQQVYGKAPILGRRQNVAAEDFYEASVKDEIVIKQLLLQKNSGTEAADIIWAMDDKGALYHLNYELSTKSYIPEKVQTNFITQKLFNINQQIFALSESGQLYLSENNSEWLALLEKSALGTISGLAAWQDILLLYGEGNKVQILDLNSLATEEVTVSSLLESVADTSKDSLGFRAAVLLSDRRFLLLDQSGFLHESRDAGKTWQKFLARGENHEVKLSDNIFFTERRQLLVCSSDGFWGSNELSLNIILEKPSDAAAPEIGDLLYLEKTSNLPWAIGRKSLSTVSLNQESNYFADWFTAANTQALPQSEDAAPGGGSGALKIWPKKDNLAEDSKLMQGIYSQQTVLPLSMNGDDALRIVHSLKGSAQDLMQGNTAFELSFWAKADNPDAFVDLQINGGNIPTKAVRRSIGTDWSRQSAVFIIPQDVRQESELQVIFDFWQSEEIYLDEVRLHRAELDSAWQEDARILRSLQPNTLRLAYLEIGNSSLPAEFYYTERGQYYLIDKDGLSAVYAGSIKSALELAEASGSQPWLCLKSSISEAELRHLMEYLFGSRQSEYGYRRMQDGSLSRWNRVFKQIYLEFLEDEGDPFDLDLERSRFVDRAIKIIQSTPEYELAKNELIFVDGMSYQDGAFISEADAYAQDYGQIKSLSTNSELRQLAHEKISILPRDAQKLLAARPQIFRSMTALEGANLAEYQCQVLSNLGLEVFTNMPNMSNTAPGGWPSDILAASLSSTAKLAGLSARQCNVDALVEDQHEGLQCFAFASGQKELIFALNLGRDVKLINFPKARPEAAKVLEYDAQGLLINEHRIGSRKGVIPLLPGAMVVLESGFAK